MTVAHLVRNTSPWTHHCRSDSLTAQQFRIDQSVDANLLIELTVGFTHCLIVIDTSHSLSSSEIGCKNTGMDIDTLNRRHCDK